MAGEFTGWAGDFKGFFTGLRVNNSKAYFEAHRRQYEQDVKRPMVALLADLESRFGPARLSRPNRDIRFSADKSPYKTNIYATTRDGGYVALGAAGLVVGGGRYMMDAAQLARFREAVAASGSGSKLAAIIDRLREKGYDMGGQELKRVPPPYPQDHGRGDLLRYKRLFYWQEWTIGPWIATPAVRERVTEAWGDGATLNAWLTRHLDV
ncbi:MAG TPA: DUF2461 domain-containing protein [Candidatus Dormibacteraeota bacterium]|nr:DUF2461 domain-containing protein [Candidatus Dormibacteraeota bacterium]